MVLNLDDWLVSSTLIDLEWPMLDVILDSLVIKLPTNESLGIKDGVLWVSGDLVLGSISDKSLLVVESDI